MFPDDMVWFVGDIIFIIIAVLYIIIKDFGWDFVVVVRANLAINVYGHYCVICGALD